MLGTAWIWIAIAAPLLVAGAVFIVRFVVGDRSRGRPRCPRCWYDMGGGQEKCPECGRAVRSERDLHRARRPKRWAVVGVGLLVLGGASLATRQAVVHGAVSLVPNWVLVAGMERWPRGEINKELWGRLGSGKLSVGEQRWLLRRALHFLESSEDPTALARSAYAISITESRADREAEEHAEPWTEWVSASSLADPAEIALRLTVLMSHEDPNVRMYMGMALQSFDESALAFPDVFLSGLEDPTKQVRQLSVPGVFSRPSRPFVYHLDAAVQSLTDGTPESANRLAYVAGLRGLSDDPALLRARLFEGLAHPDANCRLLALWMLRMGFWPDEEVRLSALRSFDPADEKSAAAIVDLALSGPLDETALSVLRRALRGPGRSTTYTAQEIVKRGVRDDRLSEEIRALFEGHWGAAFAVEYCAVTGDREGAAAKLLGAVEGGGGTVILSEQEIAQDLSEVGWVDDRVLEFWRAQLAAADPETRVAAATALLRSGSVPEPERAELTRVVLGAGVEAAGSLRTILIIVPVRLGELDLDTVLEALGDCTGQDATYVIRALGMAGSAAASALPWLRDAAESTAPGVAEAAAYAIRRIDTAST